MGAPEIGFLIIALQIITGLLSAYLIYYAQQKGKNQADKEDLKQITEIVEDVKLKNNEEIEHLRSGLSLLTDREIQIFSEEKESIIIFFSQINTWIWDSLNIYINEYNHTNYLEISQRLITMRDAYNQTNVAFAKVRLIVEDEDLIKAGHEAIKKTLDLHQFKERLLKTLVDNLTWEKVLVDQIINKKIELMTKEFRDFNKTMAEEKAAERKEITTEYFAKHLEMFNPAMETVNNFRRLAKQYLRQS